MTIYYESKLESSTTKCGCLLPPKREKKICVPLGDNLFLSKLKIILLLQVTLT